MFIDRYPRPPVDELMLTVEQLHSEWHASKQKSFVEDISITRMYMYLHYSVNDCPIFFHNDDNATPSFEMRAKYFASCGKFLF